MSTDKHIASGAPTPEECAEIGVVVLNYNDFESTTKCVRSLLACQPLPRRIVAVDNDSPNESLDVLQERFADEDRVDVVASGHNGGYSYGNNVGIRHLQAAGCRHVMIATSDTEVLTASLFAEVLAAISPTTGVIAPQIISAKGFENPMAGRLTLRYLADLMWMRLGMPGLPLRRLVARIRHGLVPRKVPPDLQETRQIAETKHGSRKVYKLEGAFMCLTENLLARIGGLDERIFMFAEEDLLAWLCVDLEFDQVLVDDAIVHHENDSSINMSWGDDASRIVVGHQRNSFRVLRSEVRMGRLLREWLRRRGT